MSDRLRLAVVGAGLMGRQHVGALDALTEAELVAIADPSEAARAYAGELGVSWHADVEAILRADKPDGIVLATPNQIHEAQGLACIAAGIPLLIEKPIATEVASAERLTDAAEAAGVPLLVGHHRRHNPIIRKAKEIIDSGALGRITAVQAACWLYKPDAYFDQQWRRQAGAGPVFINLIHDIDLLRHLCGEVVAAVARESSAARGNAVEDTAAMVLQFDNGALGTVSVSDSVVGPWSWELTAGENPAYPETGETCYWIGGTRGALALPNLRLWQQGEIRGWWEPMSGTAVEVEKADPIAEQMRHFCRVVCGLEAPLVSAREATKTLAVIAGIKRSAGGTA